MIAIKVFIWIALIIIALWAVHRLLLWMEDRGWIFYKKKQPTRVSIGSALLEVQSILDPGKKAVIEEIRKVEHDQQHSGDPIKDNNFDVNSTKDE